MSGSATTTEAYTGSSTGWNECSIPLAHRISTDLQENLRQRKALLDYGRSSREAALELWIMCSRDPVFFVNAFLWTYNPRLSTTAAVPFILYPYQVEALIEIIRCIRAGEDLIIEKSRDMGASWLIIIAYLWFWLFGDMLTFLMGSRKEEYVEKRGDPKALFSKIDFALAYLPAFLKPKYVRRDLHLRNIETGSTIDGESTNDDFARGDRRTSIVVDEAASVPNGARIATATRDATDCRIFNSTPKGHDELFWDLREKCPNRITFHWTKHPVKAKGLYYDEYGKPRSPWYDLQCKRCANQTEIAQELDISYDASSFPFFDGEIMKALRERYAHRPLWQGDIEIDAESGRILSFIPKESGPLKVWCPLDHKMRPPRDHDYVAGADISMGTGSSNSVLDIYSKRTHAQVASYAAHDKDPTVFGFIAAALLEWFSGMAGAAFVIWEGNGPGRAFGSTLMKAGHSRIFYRRNERSVAQSVARELAPGWFATKENKQVLLTKFRSAIANDELIVRCEDLYEESRYYMYQPDGGVAHEKAVSKLDPTGARDNHGDRIMASALVWRVLEGQTPETKELEPYVPVSCYAARRQKWEVAQRRTSADRWDN